MAIPTNLLLTEDERRALLKELFPQNKSPEIHELLLSGIPTEIIELLHSSKSITITADQNKYIFTAPTCTTNASTAISHDLFEFHLTEVS